VKEAGRDARMANIVVVSFVLAMLIFISIMSRRYGQRPCHPQEPVYLQPKIPLIGHVIGLMRHGGAYYAKLRYVDHLSLSDQFAIPR
jgi:hypothetical protein